jgi:signal transduction histidine kinase
LSTRSTTLPATSVSRRTALALWGALGLVILIVAVATLRLLQAQRVVVEEAVRHADTEAVTLLGHHVEDALLAAMQTPFDQFAQRQAQGEAAPPLAAVLAQSTDVVEALLLDPSLGLVERAPPAATPARRRLDGWLAHRLAVEQDEHGGLPTSLHWFLEPIDGDWVLVAFQPTSHVPGKEVAAWLLLRYDLHAMLARHVVPMLGRFGEERGVEVGLRAPTDPPAPENAHWQFQRLLQGWTLVVLRRTQEGAGRLQAQRALVLAVGGLAMLAATAAVWRELRRERALMDLRQRFVANVSHDLKSPLALIRMYAETLYLGRIGEEAKRQAYLRTIVREAERLTEMIERVLSFARSEHGVARYRLEQRDLGETVAGFLEDYGPRVHEQGLALEQRIDPELPPVPHDAGAVVEVLVNLVDNACRHAASGGRVTVLAERRGEEVALEVGDAGPGIPPHERERVRRPFEKGAGAEGSGGSGLGLAVVTQIAAAHGARLLLDAAPGGRGLVATVLFPAPGGAA